MKSTADFTLPGWWDELLADARVERLVPFAALAVAA
jgi:hypothetical protein